MGDCGGNTLKDLPEILGRHIILAATSTKRHEHIHINEMIIKTRRKSFTSHLGVVLRGTQSSGVEDLSASS